ncbi:MAG: MFS transporter [Thermoflexales bacterium]|nr:MFS transporter [Thermoflexales bacterium]
MKKVWPFAFQFLYFAGMASVMPFIILYFQSLGFSGAQIGLLNGATPITLLSAPLWTGLADTTRRHRLLMSLAILGVVTTLALFPSFHSFASIFLIAILLNTFFAPVSSFADNATMVMLAGEKELYGRLRLGGTIGYGLAASIAGALVQRYGLKFAFWAAASIYLMGLVVSQKLTHGESKTGEPAGKRIGALMANPRWRLFMAAAFAAGLALAAHNTYFFLYLKDLGANESTMGLALTIGTLSEIPVFFFGNRLLGRFKPYGLFVVAMVFTSLRLLLFAACANANLVLVIQFLNGLTFPAMWVAGVAYANENAPPGMSATAQGLFNAMVAGFGLAVGGLVGGLLLDSVGTHGIYLLFGIAVLVIAAIVALLERRLAAPDSAVP